jgi:hypothetical protein
MRFVADDGEEFAALSGPYADVREATDAAYNHPIWAKMRAGHVVTNRDTGERMRFVNGSVEVTQ